VRVEQFELLGALIVVFSTKNEDFFWNEKRLRSGIFPLQRQTDKMAL